MLEGSSLIKPVERCYLTELPDEILFEICDYLDPAFVHQVLSRTCKRLNALLYTEYFWRRSFLRRNDLSVFTRYPYLKYHKLYCDEGWISGYHPSWRELSVSVECAKKRWFDPLKTITIDDPDYSSVNTVHLMEEGLCATGSREKSITIWDIYGRRDPMHIPLAHNGWLSTISTLPDRLVSCGWDSKVKIWNISERMEPLNSYLLSLAVMDVDCKPNLIAACTFTELVIIDPRIGSLGCSHRGAHHVPIAEGSVVQVKFEESSVIMASRSRKLIRYDLRMNKISMSAGIKTLATPRLMAISDGIVYVGDNGGMVYLFDLYHEEFELIEQFNINPNTQIRALIPRKGYMIVGTSSGDLLAVLTAQEDCGIRVLQSEKYEGEIVCGHFRNDNLAILNGTTGQTTIFVKPESF